ncbi:MAG TPA: hypothetical protein VI756_17065, partial [Blastocatellia bacterium]
MRLLPASRFLLRLLLATSLCVAPCVIPCLTAPSSLPTTTAAATCTGNPIVTNNLDSGAGSLRQAILEACPGSTITFASTVKSPIMLTTADLEIDQNLTIIGPGADLLTVERSSAGGTPQFRIFTISEGVTVNISGL